MIVARYLLALVAVLVALAPAATALGVDTGSHEVTVPGQSTGVDTKGAVPARPGGPADADAGVNLETQDGRVSLDGPSCQVDETGNSRIEATSTCSTGALGATLPQAGVGYYVELRLGDQATSAGSGDAAAAATGASLLGVPVQAAPMTLLVVAAAAGSAGLLYLAWRVLKLGLLGAFIPLATHIRDDQLLDDDNRRAIYTLIKTEPGIAPKEMAERLGLAWGTVTHHLSKLERRRIVVSKKYGKYRRYFLNGGTVLPEDKDRVAVMKVARTADVATFIKEHPGMSQKEVSTSLGVSSSTILWHVKRLIEVQAINRVRAGKEVRYYPTNASGDLVIPPAPEPKAFHA